MTPALGYNWDLTPHITDEVFAESRVSEAALWLRWEYRGRLACADQNSRVAGKPQGVDSPRSDQKQPRELGKKNRQPMKGPQTSRG